MRFLNIELLSVWEMIRLTGFVSLFLLLLSIICGGLMSVFQPKNKAKVYLQFTHQSAGWLSLWIGFGHGILLYFDTFISFSLIEIFIPFTAQFERFWSGMGTISLWLLVVVILSTDLKKKFSHRTWQTIHRLSFPLFPFALLHGFMIGTDRLEPWAQTTYAFMSIIFLLTIVFIAMKRTLKTKKKTIEKPVIAKQGYHQ